MKYPSEYSNPRDYIANTFGDGTTVVDSENRLVVPISDTQQTLLTTKSICNGGTKTYSSTTNTDPSAIASGVVDARLFIGDLLALDGINGIITAGIPRVGLVGSNPYMMLGSDGLYGLYGDDDEPWFIASMKEAEYTYINPDTLATETKTFQGGDFFVGNAATAYLYWQYATHTLTIAGDVIIAGDIESANFVSTPTIVGYKLEYETGNAYFGGAIITGDSVIGSDGISADTIGSSINSSGNFIKELINTKLDTSTKEILGDFTFGASGAIKMATDDNNGLWLSPTGLLGKKSGATTFSITTSGDATFAGSITGSTITGSTITGGVVQTGTSGRIVMLNGDTSDLEFYNGTLLHGSIGTYTSASGGIGMDLNTYGSAAMINLYEYDGGTPTNQGLIYLVCNSQITLDTEIINLNGDIPSITLNGTTRSSWPTSFSGNLSDLSINTTKNWGTYGITNLGSLIPGSGTTTLGNSTYYWDNIYVGEIYGPYGSNPVYINNNAFTRSLMPYSSTSYDIGSTGYYYQNVFTQSLRLRTGLTTNPSNSGEIRYYDGTGGGFRGNVGGWLGQFDMTAK